jgi:FkbM family methyltransferase
MRILKSLQDSSFVIKLLNRVSQTEYVPSTEANIDKFLAEYYPGNGWKLLSLGAKQIWVDLSPIFSTVSINNIAYIGANDGQIAMSIDEAFPKRHFYLIEPVPSTFQKLLSNVSSRQNMKCFNMAVGAKEEALDMFVDDFSPASSLLPYEDRAIKEFPFLGKGHVINVQVKPLDEILQSCGACQIDMIIMDVQGYEDKVLQGARETLHTCKAIISELSLQYLYVESSMFDSVYQTLSRQGFSLRYLMNPIKGTSKVILQIDGVFVRD